jgi:ribonuclease HII
MKLDYEQNFWKRGLGCVAGVDEVGRGCLAGPLVAAAVILKPEHFIKNDVADSKLLSLYEQVTDSKQLSAKKRRVIAEFLNANALSVSIYSVENTDIDKWGISQATQMAFEFAVKGLKFAPEHILTDAFKIKPYPQDVQTNIIRGDIESISISAASIVAKVYRDSFMEEIHNSNKDWQVYGFDKHKGYGTKFHKGALLKYGPCSIHRMSFKPLNTLAFS